MWAAAAHAACEALRSPLPSDGGRALHGTHPQWSQGAEWSWGATAKG